MNKPNHICKNPRCKTHYYACDECDNNRSLNWRAVTCSIDCFKEYMNLVDKIHLKNENNSEEIN